MLAALLLLEAEALLDAAEEATDDEAVDEAMDDEVADEATDDTEVATPAAEPPPPPQATSDRLRPKFKLRFSAIRYERFMAWEMKGDGGEKQYAGKANQPQISASGAPFWRQAMIVTNASACGSLPLSHGTARDAKRPVVARRFKLHAN